MSTQYSMNLRNSTDSGRYFQSGLSRGAPVSLYRSNATTNASAVASLIPSTGYKASATTNVFEIGPYDSVRVIVGLVMSTAATSFDFRMRAYTVSNGTAAIYQRRTVAAGIVQIVDDYDRHTTNGTFTFNYERLGSQFVDFQGRTNGARGRSFTATVIPYHSGGGR